MKLIAHLNDILNNDEVCRNNERRLGEIRDKIYGDERRTKSNVHLHARKVTIE